MEACGETCVSLCKQLLLPETSMKEISWYVSPTPEQGRKEAEAFENFVESGFSM